MDIAGCLPLLLADVLTALKLWRITIYSTVYYIGLFRTVHKVSAVHHFLKPVNGLLLVTRAAIDIVIVAITHLAQNLESLS